jgi:hypothetical protein
VKKRKWNLCDYTQIKYFLMGIQYPYVPKVNKTTCFFSYCYIHDMYEFIVWKKKLTNLPKQIKRANCSEYISRCLKAADHILTVKIKSSLCFIFNIAPRHEGVVGSGSIAPRILDLVAYGGEWSASCPGRFTPRKRVPGNDCIGGWVGPRAGLDAAVKRKIPSRYRDSNRRSSSP